MFGYQINHSFPCLSIQLLSDAIPGKTLFLVFDIVFLKSLDIGWNTLFSVFGYKKRLQDNTLDLPGERKNVVYVGK